MLEFCGLAERGCLCLGGHLREASLILGFGQINLQVEFLEIPYGMGVREAKNWQTTMHSRPKSILHTTLAHIEAEMVLLLVGDFCEMLRWDRAEYSDYTLFNFFEIVMMQSPDSFSLDHIAQPRILGKKLGKIQSGEIQALCRELKNGDTIDQHSSTTLLAFFKSHFEYLLPKPLPEAHQIGHDITTRTILQRRKNAL